MIQKTAGQLSSAIAHYYHVRDEYSPDDAHAIDRAAFLHLRSVLPEPQAVIVTEHQDGMPALLAIHAKSLFVVTVAPREDGGGRTAETEQVVYPLDSRRCRLRAKAVCFGGSHSWGHTRRTTWHLTVDDFEIEFTGNRSEDGVDDPKEEFARTLGIALGWTFADDEAHLKAA
jgi:hypothetical protein